MDDQSTGPSVDRHGSPVVDPTKNVLDLVDVSNKRHDDLAFLRDKRIDDIIALDRAHDQEIRRTISSYEEKLRVAEADRLNAIRLRDVRSVEEAARVQTETARALALQVSSTEDSMRAQFAALTSNFTASLVTAMQPVQQDLKDLRDKQFTQQGEKAAQGEQKIDRRDDRSVNFWLIGLAVTIAIFLMNAFLSVAFFLVVHFFG